MESTKILGSLNTNNISKKDLKKMHENYDKIKKFLNEKENIVDITFTIFLKKIELNQEDI